MPDAPTITTYVSDMLALEQHMMQPIQHQVDDKDVQGFTPALRLLQEAASTVQTHVTGLESLLQSLGGHAGSPLKSGVASALGGIASAIGSARKTEVAKYLRDDYAALSLASASYTMLHTTALAMGEHATAAFAKTSLTDYAGLIMKISETLPLATITDLQSEGAAVDASVIEDAKKATDDAWSQGASRV